MECKMWKTKNVFSLSLASCTVAKHSKLRAQYMEDPLKKRKRLLFLIIMYLLSPQPTSSNPQHQVEPAANEWIYPKGYQRPFNAASIKHGRTLVSRDFRNYYKMAIYLNFCISLEWSFKKLLCWLWCGLEKVTGVLFFRGKFRGSHKRQFHARAQTCFCIK